MQNEDIPTIISGKSPTTTINAKNFPRSVPKSFRDLFIAYIPSLSFDDR